MTRKTTVGRPRTTALNKNDHASTNLPSVVGGLSSSPKQHPSRFNTSTFEAICRDLAGRDEHLAGVIDTYGYPPMWTRPNTFETLVLTILEQQVSLASAYAAFKRLRERIGTITPVKLLELSDEELKACSFSRQKILYTRELAQALILDRISLRRFYHQPDEIVRAELKKLKGIGDWTVDIYLIHALRRADVFPLGDLALVKSMRMLKGEALQRDDMLQIAEAWRPWRTLASFLLWHYYIRKKNIRLQH